jgi:hypothetical protein
MHKHWIVLAPFVLAALACNLPAAPSGGVVSADAGATAAAATLAASGATAGATGVPTTGSAATASTSIPGSTPSLEPVGGLPAPLYYLGDDSQVWRVEVDAATLTQITFEPMRVVSFDVSLADGSVAYVSNNTLFRVDALGAGRTQFLNGPPLPAAEDYAGQVNGTIGAVLWSPTGDRIAYGLGGVNVYDLPSGETVLLLPSSPYPDLSGELPPDPIRFYSPASWAPDGARLLVNVSYFPEAGGLAFLTLDGTSYEELTNPDGIVCCSPAWSTDATAVYTSSAQVGMIAAGLWRADIATGQGVALIAGQQPDGSWALPGFAALLSDGQLYYFFATSSEEYPTGDELLTMTRSAPDGVAGRTALRADGYQVFNVLWDHDARGAVIVDTSTVDFSVYPSTGTMIWLPADGGPAVTLPAPGRDMVWGR